MLYTLGVYTWKIKKNDLEQWVSTFRWRHWPRQNVTFWTFVLFLSPLKKKNTFWNHICHRIHSRTFALKLCGKTISQYTCPFPTVHLTHGQPLANHVDLSIHRPPCQNLNNPPWYFSISILGRGGAPAKCQGQSGGWKERQGRCWEICLL